jgi:hypothetical protein
MKKSLWLAVVSVVFLTTSCSITETLVMNENGSGKFSYDIDGSKMMSMIGNIGLGEESKSKKKQKKETKKERVSKDIDSTFSFKELFASKKDSIAKLSPEEQAKIKRMENFKIHMVMNEEKGIMNYSMFTEFNTVKELQDLMSPIESMKTVSPVGKSGGFAMAPNDIEDNSQTKFFFDGKIFRKEVSKLEKKEVALKEEISEDSKQLSEDLKLNESMEMFYAQSNFKLVYQFPKAVKIVSLENALYSEDRKTITIEYSLKEYVEHPEKLTFEIQF